MLHRMINESKPKELESIINDSKVRYIDMIHEDNKTYYLYQIQSRSDPTSVYTITCNIIDDDSIKNTPTIECECVCMGYKHREKCWHIDEINYLFSNLSCCVLCLTPFLDITLNNGRDVVNCYDQDKNKLIISKDGKHLAHESCVINYDEFNDKEIESFIKQYYYFISEGNK